MFSKPLIALRVNGLLACGPWSNLAQKNRPTSAEEWSDNRCAEATGLAFLLAAGTMVRTNWVTPADFSRAETSIRRAQQQHCYQSSTVIGQQLITITNLFVKWSITITPRAVGCWALLSAFRMVLADVSYHDIANRQCVSNTIIKKKKTQSNFRIKLPSNVKFIGKTRLGINRRRVEKYYGG